MRRHRSFRQWIRASLGRKLAVALLASLVLVSTAFLALFVQTYRTRLLDERAATATQVNELLQATLENAMLKRDLDGLREIVDRLGSQESISDVMIVAPSGEIRFAARPAALGQTFALDGLLAGATPPPASSAFVVDPAGREVLRSINPVRNREPCTQCHGPMLDHPVNGVLVVDYDATGIKHEALFGALLLSGSRVVVIVIALLGTWLVLHRSMIRPLRVLTRVGRTLAQGDLAARSGLDGDDELGVLGRTLDHMADRLQTSQRAEQEREAFLQALIDAIPDGIRVIDSDYRVLQVNRAFLDQLGTTAAEVVGQPCYRSTHRLDGPCSPTLVTCPLHELAGRSGVVTCRHRHQRADGRELFVEVVAAPFEATLNGRRRRMVVEAVRRSHPEPASLPRAEAVRDRPPGDRRRPRDLRPVGPDPAAQSGPSPRSRAG
jgi:PAS domain S-box-containing protein